MRNVWQNFTWCMSHYVDGAGRANRAEYWSFVLFEFLFLIVAMIIDGVISAVINSGHQPNQTIFLPIFTCLFGLACIVPGIALLSRRLHDVA